MFEEKYESENEDEDSEPEILGSFDKVVLSIDIGINNLGVAVGLISSMYELSEIAWVDKLDIKRYTHEKGLAQYGRHGSEKGQCPHHHTRTVADWLRHLFLEHAALFDQADYIIVERQPITGITVVEQLIYYQFRDKCFLVSPNSMHSFFRIRELDYEQRKERTVKISQEVTKWHPRATENFERFERQHDISDAICLMVFWLYQRRKSALEKQHRNRVRSTVLTYNGSTLTLDEWFEQFRYVPKGQRIVVNRTVDRIRSVPIPV